ncbi:MAG: hypothetical protein JWQ24_4159 [Tardiphaga sp.]|nr:hypothetical protein [Tardiphaga sp.]
MPGYRVPAQPDEALREAGPLGKGWWGARSAATNAFTYQAAYTHYEAYLPFDELA